MVVVVFAAVVRVVVGVSVVVVAVDVIPAAVVVVAAAGGSPVSRPRPALLNLLPASTCCCEWKRVDVNVAPVDQPKDGD